ncbi:MAG: hypothetical protein GY732_13180, partial [Gammaproteobacteria bacterium]|nr:hypothetical protein [Gammaproteobacteria bacterium]
TNATLPATVTQEQIESAINNPGASAWGDVGATGTLNNGLNIASVTREALGYYTVVFRTPMPDANYAIVGSVNGSNSSVFFVANNTKTATGFTYGLVQSTNGSQAVDGKVAFTVHATNALPPRGGTGTDAWGTILASGARGSSFNVADSAYLGGGNYQVTFTTPMPSGDYSIQATSVTGWTCGVNNQNSAGFQISIRSATDGAADQKDFSFTVNATNAQLPDTFTIEQFNDLVARVTALENP